jgi:hypothetical protein
VAELAFRLPTSAEVPAAVVSVTVESVAPVESEPTSLLVWALPVSGALLVVVSVVPVEPLTPSVSLAEPLPVVGWVPSVVELVVEG